jgi:hypothetical protein
MQSSASTAVRSSGRWAVWAFRGLLTQWYAETAVRDGNDFGAPSGFQFAAIFVAAFGNECGVTRY